MTEEVYRAIDSYRGNGFNDKLGNLVLDFIEGRTDMERDLMLLKEHITDKQMEMCRLQNRIRAMQGVESRFAGLVDALSLLLDG